MYTVCISIYLSVYLSIYLSIYISVYNDDLVIASAGKGGYGMVAEQSHTEQSHTT